VIVMNKSGWTGATMALVSAALFGASTPLAKSLLGSVSPWLLAGLLYLGSGIGLFALSFIRGNRAHVEAPLRRKDLPWLAGAVLAGGVVGPLLLMLGLSTTAAASAALLLNLEGLATMAIAWLAFREATGARVMIGAFAILAAAIVLSWQGSGLSFETGGLFIVGACIAWGVDNNLTRKISASDPVQIAMIKGLVAGAVNFGLAMAFGNQMPSAWTTLAAGIVGLLGYGLSLILFLLALRSLGTARTGAYFSAAPFIGATISIALLSEPLTIQFGAAALLMGLGVYLHVTEWHEHMHTHEEMEHEHAHMHDPHHQHEHGPNDPPGEPHSHWHRHLPMTHKHPHFPDLHHTHSHEH
jgi:drug/metabolite transporter (DMT)-like permease